MAMDHNRPSLVLQPIRNYHTILCIIKVATSHGNSYYHYEQCTTTVCPNMKITHDNLLIRLVSITLTAGLAYNSLGIVGKGMTCFPPPAETGNILKLLTSTVGKD